MRCRFAPPHAVAFLLRSFPDGFSLQGNTHGILVDVADLVEVEIGVRSVVIDNQLDDDLADVVPGLVDPGVYVVERVNLSGPGGHHLVDDQVLDTSAGGL